MRKIRGRKLKRQKQIVILSLFLFMAFFATGYAAFSTKIRLNAKGNIKSINVTFDPNGGILDINNKRVVKGRVYGNLPIPTREGYTFIGWHGKNLVNIENHNVTITNSYYRDLIPTPKYILNPNTNYTLTFNYIINSATNGVFSTVGYGLTGFQRDIKSSSAYSGTGKMELNFTTPASFDYNPAYVAFRFVRMGSPGDANVDISNIQLEEGDSATDYEPYYVTSETTVTQEQNHILTAIWEEDEQTNEP